MRLFTISPLLGILTLLQPTTPITSPFHPADPAEAPPPLRLLPRAGPSCASSGNSCSALGAPGLCCSSKAICALDPLNNVACCPLNAACTGTISPVSSVLPTTTAAAIVTATITPAPTPGGTVPNAYFPFVYLPTSFPNAAACSSSVAGCQATYSSCASSLGSTGANPVTVVANGGVTIIAPVGSVSASQICSSLSGIACYGLQLASCATITGTAPTVQGTFVPGTGVGERRRNGGWGVGMGLLLGILGVVG